jgi:hypothetical protein
VADADLTRDHRRTQLRAPLELLDILEPEAMRGVSPEGLTVK